MKTVRIQKICPGDQMDMAKWLHETGDCLRFKSLVCWIGISYLMVESDGQVIYAYASRDKSFFSKKLRTKV